MKNICEFEYRFEEYFNGDLSHDDELELLKSVIEGRNNDEGDSGVDREMLQERTEHRRNAVEAAVRNLQ